MHYLKIPLSAEDLERLALIAAARNPAPTLPNLAIEALNEQHQLNPPIPPSKRVGNPTGNKGKPIKQPKRKPKGDKKNDND